MRMLAEFFPEFIEKLMRLICFILPEIVTKESPVEILGLFY